MAANGNSKAVPESGGNTQNAGGFHDPFNEDGFDEASDLGQRAGRRLRGRPLLWIRLSLTEQQKLERRERNREHAKRSRIRKKVLLDLLQDQLVALRKENVKLRAVVSEKIPDKALLSWHNVQQKRACCYFLTMRAKPPPRRPQVTGGVDELPSASVRGNLRVVCSRVHVSLWSPISG